MGAQFASDNWAGVCPEAWAALAAANAGHAPAYGGDDWTQAAIAAIRGVFETECEVFFVFNGTAANSLALSALCRGTDAIICHANAHINVDECGAPGFFSGGAKLLTADTPHAKLTVEAVERLAVTPHDVHSARPRALSLTQATEHGTLYTPLEMWELADCAHRLGMKVHVDGARFANAVAALDCAPADIAWRAGVDALSFGGTKNGLPFGEAVVFFDPALADEFGRRRMQGGQLASKMRFLAAPWQGVLAGGAWLSHAAHANAMARRLADALAGVPGTRLLAPVEANGVFIDMPPPMIAGLRERGWQFYEFIGATGVRLMCAWDTPAETVDALARDAHEVARLEGFT
ncbi:MAG: low specificity L-threonine aldolase [Burkholderiales bacterium]|nr:low specificity L-threonine aldolase [Burkholderiales bacterium]